jgi:DNA-binding IclR family transcriptional regulator
MPALRHGVAVLRFLAGKPGPVGAVAIARGLGLPRSSTYQILQVLTDEGLVVHIPDAQGFTLAVGVFELGSAYLRHQPLELLARPLLNRLMLTVNLTAHVGILYGHETVYLLKEQPARATTLVTDIGVRLPAHLTATGRAMLAMLPPSQVMAIYASRGAFIQRTERGPKTLRELRTLLAHDRERGFSVEDGHTTDGVTCIAAAAVDHNGMPVASFSVSFLSDQLPPGEAHVRVGEATREAAAQLTRRIKGDPSALKPRRVTG